MAQHLTHADDCELTMKVSTSNMHQSLNTQSLRQCGGEALFIQQHTHSAKLLYEVIKSKSM